MSQRLLLFTLCFSLIVQPFYAQQVDFTYSNLIVSKEGNTLTHGFAGGLNSGQYQTIDFDGDEDLDLVVFDRSSNQLNCFENTGSNYRFAPEFQYHFPPDLDSWLVLADYDCDGDKDLFTASNLGAKVYRNDFDDKLNWELITDPLLTLGSSMTNLFFNRTDIPAIADQDGDGDLDILVFNFAGGEKIEFHKNYSIENSGSCGLEFVVETRDYGGISECGCGTIVFNSDCPSGGRERHIGAKALLSYDHDLDGDMDLIFNQENCLNLEFIENKGSTTSPAFDEFRSDFPNFSNDLSFTIFPAAYREDVTFDGQPDILIAPNERSNSGNNIDFKRSSLLYSNSSETGNQYSLTTSSFLQDQMIDVGEFAYPTFADVDGDGQEDLIIGNRGSLVNGTFESTLTYLRRSGKGFEWQTDDFLNLSSLNFINIIPQFLDWDGDGKDDLIIAASDNTFNASLFFLPNTGDGQMQFDLASIQNLGTTLSLSEDFQIVDVNRDGNDDLLVGEFSGRLNYFRNEGTNESPNFIIADETYLDLDFSSDRTSLFLSARDLDDNGVMDLIVTDRTGGARLYQNLTEFGSDPVAELVLENTELVSRFGRQSKPALGTDGLLAIGSIQGGLQMVNLVPFTPTNETTFSVYPVPAHTSELINFVTNSDGFVLEIVTLTGQRIFHGIELTANEVASIDKTLFEPGIYVSRISNGNAMKSQKFIVD